jgi:hypothetical protein
MPHFNFKRSEGNKAFDKAWKTYTDVHAYLFPTGQLQSKPLYASPSLVLASVTVDVTEIELPAAAGGGGGGSGAVEEGRSVKKMKKSLSFSHREIAFSDLSSPPKGSISREDEFFLFGSSGGGGSTDGGGGVSESSFHENAAAVASPRC